MASAKEISFADISIKGLAIIWGMQLALETRFRMIEVKLNILQVVSCISKKKKKIRHSMLWVCLLTEDIAIHFEPFIFNSFNYCFQKINMPTHHLV